MSPGGRAAVVLVMMAALSACSAEQVAPTGPANTGSASASVTASTAEGPAPTGSPSPMMTVGPPPADPRDAAREVQAYLDEWIKNGAAAASQKYLVADQRVTSDDEAPRLTSGKLVEVKGVQQASGEVLLQVTLDLTFDGNSGAWGQGHNDRFVRFTERAGGIPEMSFSTGP